MDEKVTLEYEPGAQEFYLSVPFGRRGDVKSIGGRWSQERHAWRFPVDSRVWEDIKAVFGGQGDLMVAKSFLSEMKVRSEAVEEFFRLKKFAEEDNPVNFEVPGISLGGKNPLFNYQKWGIKCGLQVGDGFLIGDTPGLGKTIQAIGIALERRRRGEVGNCLIVCLASLKYNWLDEIAKFTKERAIVVDGPPEERRRKWVAGGYFFKIANYETVVGDLFLDRNPRRRGRKALSRQETEFRRCMQGSFDMVVADEVHAIKTHASQRSQAMKQLRAKYRLGLSGTPVDGKLEELHSIYEFLKPGLFESRALFLERHAILDMFGGVKGYVGIREVREKILPYYIRRTKEAVLKDLPAKLFKDIYVDLPAKDSALYRELVSGASEITSEEDAAVRLLRVRQFLDFPELLDIHLPSCKFQAFEQLLDELVRGNGEKVLVFTQYREVLERIVRSLGGKYDILQIHGDTPSRDRVEIVRDFNENPRRNILIGTDAMSTGLNIGGANSVIHYEDNYSPAMMQQRNDRAHRATTRHNVTVYRFVCRGTIEERVRKALAGKMDLNNQVLDESCSEFGTPQLSSLDLLSYL